MKLIIRCSEYGFTFRVVLGFVVFATFQAQASDYQFNDFGGQDPISPVSALGLNNQGDVVGYRTFSSDSQRMDAVYWHDGQWNTLAIPAGNPANTWNAVWGINDHGQIAGFFGPYPTVQDVSYPARWDNGVPTQLDDLGHRDYATYAFGINNNGMLSGVSWVGNTFHAVYWNPGETAVHDLGTLGGSLSITTTGAINDAGLIVGVGNTLNDDAQHAIAWDTSNNGAAHDLGTLGGTNSWAWGNNNVGQIVGQADLSGDAAKHAALWDSFAAAPIDLGTLGGANSQAMSINEAGQIVGWSETASGETHLALWDHGQIIDLTKYLSPDLLASGWSIIQGGIQEGEFINDSGVILGELVDSNGHDHPFTLTPTAVPLPGAVWLFGSAFAGMFGFGRRKQIEAG